MSRGKNHVKLVCCAIEVLVYSRISTGPL